MKTNMKDNYLIILAESIHAVFSNTKHTEINNIKSYHLIASTYFIDRTLVISFHDLICNMKVLNIKKLIIFYILQLEQDDIDKQYNNFICDTLEVIYVSFDRFTYIINSSDFNFNTTNKHCLYIFHDMSWSNIVLKLSTGLNLTVSGGSNVKRHLLSPLHVRFCSYLIAIFNLNSLEAYNHNNFNGLDKDIYLPYIDLSNKSSISVTKHGIKTTIPYLDNSLANDKHTNSFNRISSLENKTNKKEFHSYSNVLNHINTKFVKHISTSTEHMTNKSFLSNCFKEIEILLQNKEHNIELQNEIEEYLFDNKNHLINKPSTSINFSSVTSKWIIEKYELIVEHLNNMLNKDVTLNKGKTTLIQQNLLHTKQVLSVLGSKTCANILISFFLDLVSKETNEGRLIQIDCFTSLGKKLVNIYTYILYKKYCKTHNVSISLSEWKDLDKNHNHLYESQITVAIAGNLVQFLTTASVNIIELTTEYGDDRKLHNTIRIQEDARSIVIKSENTKIFSVPTKLPMIVEPKQYKLVDNKIILGGFLKNDISYVENLFIDKVGYKYTTKLKKDNDIIDLINGVSRVPYKINKETLEFIQLYGVEKGIIISVDQSKYNTVKTTPNNESNKFVYKPYIKRSKKLDKQLRSVQSSIYMQTNILNIAELYSLVDKIYFPVRLDQRTRLYCSTEYLNYQSTDLAKGLLLFAKPGFIYKDDIDSINYLKSYGATLFDSVLDKKSLNYKVKWIDNNTDYILNFKFNDIINKSNHKACFLSFCFEYTRFVEFMNDINATIFTTYLPIQLDASCNGYQHLSLLTRDKKVLKQLNLTPSTKDDDPDDLYNFMLIKVREYLNNRLSSKISDDEERLSIIRLDKIHLNRSIVKKALMTYSYNTSTPQMVSYIKQMLNSYNIDELKSLMSKQPDSSLEQNNVNIKFVDKFSESFINDNEFNENFIDTNKDDKKNNKFYVAGDNYNNYITSKDIYNFVKYFKIVLNNEFPRMKLLNSYIRDIVKICTKLNIAVPWALPSGAIISQSYLNSKTLKTRPFSFIKSKYNFRTIIQNEFDQVKQLNATMPNLIHSLDASSIAILYKVFYEYEGENIYTIHDCFAVTANNVKLLIGVLKGVYINIYSENVYLSGLDKHIKNTILSIFGSDVFSCNYKFIYIWNQKTEKTEKIAYPSIDKVLDLNTNIVDLKHSEYIIK